MNRIPERVVDGGYVEIDVLFVTPDVRHGKSDVVGERSRPCHANPHGVRAQMAATCQTVAAPAADHMSLAGDNVADVEIIHIRSGVDNLADKFVANHKRHRDGPLRPLVPVVDVQIGSANPGAKHTN